VESVSFAEYQEWPLDSGFLKHIKIGNKIIYNLEFQLLSVQEHLYSKALGIRSDKKTSTETATPHDTSAHSKIYPGPVRPWIKRVPWTPEEDMTVLKIRDEDGYSWEEIHDDLPHRTPQTIQAYYYTIRAGIGKADISGGQQQKRRQGRPRKQT
jgi:Myb-like DNA-binding domain